MPESVFKKRTVADIHDEIREQYLSDNRPWIIGFSGGKDSTCLAQLVWNALSRLPKEKLQKKVYIISSDTLVESPQIAQRITNNLDNIEKAAKKIGLPIGTNLLRPPTEDTFWVRLLGRGYPAPTNMFRWCTDMLKINNADRFIKDKVSEYGEAIVLLGMRKSESVSRNQTMNMYKIENSLLSKHSKFAQTYVYTPLEDFTAEDVWNYLLQNKNPWGEENRDLLALYQDANASECPLVVDTSTPSCGGGRFGCWTCTVVDKQNYLTNIAEKGEKWMEVLDKLRNKLKDTQDSKMWPEVREEKRRRGNVQIKTEKIICKECGELNDVGRTHCKVIVPSKVHEDEHYGDCDCPQAYKDDGKPRGCGAELSTYTPGPYTMKFRKEYLRELLEGQEKVREMKNDPNLDLILDEEIHEIQRLWRVEQGDWKNSAYEIYENVTGKKLEDATNEDMVGFGAHEQQLLMETCQEQSVPYQLVSTLLNLEFEYQGGKKHTKIFDKIEKELKKEWRDTKDKKVFKEILQELAKDKKIMTEAKSLTREDTEESLIFKIIKEKEEDNRLPILKDYLKKLLKNLEEQLKDAKKLKDEGEVAEIENKISRLKDEDYWWNDK
tara:strand:- start:2361 stop:4181 length:1821 start_codon:yes stop_codon:yes gene_type:complete